VKTLSTGEREVRVMPKPHITKDMLIGEVLEKCPQAHDVFHEHGMECPVCLGADMETLELGAALHGVDADEMIAEMNALCEQHAAECEECGFEEA
jgi:hybrid cluster-associated redox disulfide protein